MLAEVQYNVKKNLFGYLMKYGTFKKNYLLIFYLAWKMQAVMFAISTHPHLLIFFKKEIELVIVLSSERNKNSTLH